MLIGAGDEGVVIVVTRWVVSDGMDGGWWMGIGWMIWMIWINWK